MNKLKTKNCIVCGKSYEKGEASYAYWNTRKYCSLPCCRSVPRSDELKKKISDSCKKKGVGKWTHGQKWTPEARMHQSKKMKEIVSKGIHNFWKGGISEQSRTWRSNFQGTVEYRLWRTAVFQKDNYTCIWCGARNGEGKAVVLNADHIKSFADYPELRLEVSNGRTLCRDCHYKRHSKHR